jgi:hypothetical protein
VSWTTEGDVCAGVLRGEFDLISAEALIDSMLAGAASGIRTFQLDVTGVTRTRTVAGGLLRTIRQHLTDRGVVVTVEGNLD